ncbi:putative transporter [Vanrija pseudolonga]|uniref:Purtative transporter n=1 Tax=Vanrija pseudolonga TaxID=143232 RepID=A0AAF0Y984_9TREE|nr:purtative transporter [Vanrija pseudolonga]
MWKFFLGTRTRSSLTMSTKQHDHLDHDHKDAGTLVQHSAAEAMDAKGGQDLVEEEFTEAEYKRLRLKFDLILMPMLMICKVDVTAAANRAVYGLQFSDKTALTWGLIFNLREDTHMSLQQYSLLSVWFYMAYGVFQLPMMSLLQRVPLGRGLAACIIIWGGMVMAHAACKSYAELTVVRILLGWFECVVTPGFAIFTSSWYLRREQTHRQMMYYSMNSFFSVVFGVGVYFIAKNAEERGGMSGWRVINLFLGGTTVGMGIVFLVFGGTPQEVWWLSAREKRMAQARIVSNATGTGAQATWNWDQVKECFKDPQFYFGILYGFMAQIPNGAITTFSSLVIKSFGFDSLQTVLYNIPGYATAFAFIITSATLVLYVPKLRFPLALFFQLVTFIALLFIAVAPNAGKWARWGVWTAFSHVFPLGTFLVAWPMMSLNIAGRTKKTFFSSCCLVSYCVGNMVGTQIMRPSDSPRYVKGLTITSIFLLVNSTNLVVWWMYLRRENKKRDAECEASGISAEEREQLNQQAGVDDITDRKNRNFRYFH